MARYSPLSLSQQLCVLPGAGATCAGSSLNQGEENMDQAYSLISFLDEGRFPFELWCFKAANLSG